MYLHRLTEVVEIIPVQSQLIIKPWSVETHVNLSIYYDDRYVVLVGYLLHGFKGQRVLTNVEICVRYLFLFQKLL